MKQRGVFEIFRGQVCGGFATLTRIAGSGARKWAAKVSPFSSIVSARRKS